MKTFTWDISADGSETSKYATSKVQFGDGYEQVSYTGINNKRKAWQCSKKDYKPVIDAIYAFLGDTKAIEPFLFQPIKDEPAMYVRLSGDISRQKVGGNVWQISFNLEQVFLP